MFAQSSSPARRAQQSLFLLQRLNTCIRHGKIGSFISRNLQISPGFSSENDLGFSGNGVLPRVIVPLHLLTGFRYFSADPQLPSESHEDFSKLDGKEINEGKDFKDGSEVGISSQAEPESSQSKTVALFFKEAIGLDKKSESKRPKLEFEGLSDLPPEEQVKKLKSMLESQRRLINVLKDNVDDLDNTLTKLNNKNALPETAKDQIAHVFLELKRSLRGKIDSITEELSIPKESVKSEQKKKNVKKKKEGVKNEQKMPIIKKKTEGDSGSLEHLWPEWVQFVEHLNERGYLSKAVDFEDGPVDLQGHTTGELYRFIRLAAISFAKDNAEISELLSTSDLRKAALFCCPSLETRVIAAVRRLRSFISSEEDIDCAPSDLEDICNTPSVKPLRLNDVIRLLCAYGLDAEKNEVPIPDDVRQSVVNLLEEIVDLSTSSVKDGQGLSLEE